MIVTIPVGCHQIETMPSLLGFDQENMKLIFKNAYLLILWKTLNRFQPSLTSRTMIWFSRQPGRVYKRLSEPTKKGPRRVSF